MKQVFDLIYATTARPVFDSSPVQVIRGKGYIHLKTRTHGTFELTEKDLKDLYTALDFSPNILNVLRGLAVYSPVAVKQMLSEACL